MKEKTGGDWTNTQSDCRQSVHRFLEYLPSDSSNRTNSTNNFLSVLIVLFRIDRVVLCVYFTELFSSLKRFQLN